MYIVVVSAVRAYVLVFLFEFLLKAFVLACNYGGWIHYFGAWTCFFFLNTLSRAV